MNRGWFLPIVIGALVGCTGEVTGGGADPVEVDGSPGAPPEPDAQPDPGRTVVIDGPEVLPHVQAFANAACNAVGACQPSTYEGHHPSADRALDTLMSDSYGMLPSDDNALGEAHSAFALAHQTEYGVWYVIWRQRINFGDGWEAMEDRGSITQNHYDHVHVSFEETAP